MARRRNNYSNYTKTTIRARDSDRLTRYTRKMKIAKIERIENDVRELKLVFEGGTRYSIFESNEKYRYSNHFNVLWSELKEGMVAEIDLYGMRILDVQIDIPQ